jgi:hypothetical protein
MHRHSGNRTWRESAAHSHPGHRIAVRPHLRCSSRGRENACYHATMEHEFSPVHRVIGFQRFKPPDSKVAALQKIKDKDRVTNAPPLRRLRQSIKLPSTYNSLNSPLSSCLSSRIARGIVNANHSIMSTTAVHCVADCVGSGGPQLQLLFLCWICRLCCLSGTERQLTPALDVLFRNQIIQANQFIFSALAPRIC